jgi:hypothetical protein
MALVRGQDAVGGAGFDKVCVDGNAVAEPAAKLAEGTTGAEQLFVHVVPGALRLEDEV